ncbi:MAG TPA: S8 family serine peptidase, partial [Egibacteraceae bacterium]|nr:S8 family serine peptidase [Egibacteraceae bacterium]
MTSMFPHHRVLAVRCAALLAFLLTAMTAAAPAAAGQEASGGAPGGHAPVATHDGGDALPGRLLVTLDADVALGSTVAPFGGSAEPISDSVHLVRVPPARRGEAELALRRLPGVRAVEPDRLRPWARVPDDAQFAEQWSHTMTLAPRAWDTTVGSRDVRVALIDSGVRGNHAELAGNVLEQVDLSSGAPVPRARGVDNDTCEIGHGTQVAGIIGAAGDNGMGVAGVAWEVGIIDLAVSALATPGSCDGASDSAILAALHYATYHPSGPVDVVNLSVGGRQAFCPEAYERAIDEARREGVVVIAAAGNSGPETAQVPASCPGVIAVGAVDVDGRVPSYSATNPWVDLVAPGGGDSTSHMLLTTSRRGDWTRVRGTSFAAPYVSGVVALMRAVNPLLSPDEVESVLERSAHDGGLGRTDAQGWGRVHAARALSWVRRDLSIPPPEAEPYFPVLRVHSLAPGPGPERLGSHDGATDPVLQAAQVSRAVFREAGAVHAVVARADDFADALAGSALGMGVGPLLFNAPGQELSPQVRKELRRALPAGARVYVLGGERGLGRGVADDLRGMG